jgi:hypothetical protein
MSSKFSPPTKEELQDFKQKDTTSSSKFSPPTVEEIDNFKKQQDESAFNQSLNQTAAAITGTKVGSGLQSLVETLPKKIDDALVGVSTMISPYNKEQMRDIKSNYSQYSSIDPNASFQKLENQAIDTNTLANTLEKQAYEPLRSQSITPDQYKKLVLNTATSIDEYGRPRFAKPISESEISKIKTQATEGMGSLMQKMEQEGISSFANEKAKEALELARVSGLHQIDDETANIILEETRDKVMQNPTEFGYKSKPDVMSLFEEYENLKNKGMVSKSSVDSFPELEGKSMKPEYNAAVKEMLKQSSNADIPADELYNINQKLAELGYKADGGIDKEFAAAGQQEIRQKVKELNPAASDLFAQESVEIKKLDALEEAGYIKRGNLPDRHKKGFVTLSKTELGKIASDLANSDKTKLSDVVSRIEMLKGYVSPDVFKELQLASYKALENKDLITHIPLSSTNATLQGLSSPKVARMVGTLPEAIATNFPTTTKVAKTVGKYAAKSLPAIAGGLASMTASAAEEALDPETSGALPGTTDIEDRRNAPIPMNEMGDKGITSSYWFEKGYRDPEEQIQKARLSSFKSGLPNQGRADNIPGPYDKRKDYKEAVLKADKEGKLKPNYVEKFESTDSNDINEFMNFLNTSGDRAGEEYSRVLNQIADAPEREKAATLFALNQNPAFRDMAKKFKGNA